MLIELHGSPRIEVAAEGISATYSYETKLSPESALGLLPQVGAAHPNPAMAGVYFSSASLKVRSDDASTLVDLVYRTPDLGLTSAGERWEYDHQAQMQHITSVADPLNQIHWPPQFNSGSVIGFDGQEVQGVDVFRPASSFRVTVEMATIFPGQRRFLFEAQGSVNNFDWCGFYAGEVLYLGASIKQNERDRIEVTYSFQSKSYAPMTQVYLLDGSSVPLTPAPWDYVWFQHGETVINSGSGSVRQKGIKSVHIARVYNLLDFGNFPIVGPYG